MAAGSDEHRGQRIVVEPHLDGFRWVLLSSSGEAVERSAYTYATKTGARLAGESHLARIAR